MKRYGAFVGLAAGLALAAAPVSASLGGGSVHKVKAAMYLNGLACSPSGSCIAVGVSQRNALNESSGVVVPVSNRVPGKATRIPGVLLYGVACPHSHLCIAVGQSLKTPGGAIVLIKNGKAAAPQMIAGYYLSSIGCGSSTSCWATAGAAGAGAPAFVHISSTGTATVHVLTGAPAQLLAVGEGSSDAPVCSSASKCLLAATTGYPNGHGLIVSIVNGKLTASHPVTGPTAFDSLSCPTSSLCVASGYSPTSGYVVTVKNGKPGAAHKVPGTSYLGAVTCRSAAHCFAFGLNKTAFVATAINNHKAGKTIKIPVDIHSAACSSSSCTAVGLVGQYPAEQGVVYGFS